MILVQHIPTEGPFKGIAHYIWWDNSKHEPAPGASFMDKVGITAYMKENAKGDFPKLNQWFAHCADHGTGHLNIIVTPERVFSKARVPESRDRLSPAIAWELFGQ